MTIGGVSVLNLEPMTWKLFFAFIPTTIAVVSVLNLEPMTWKPRAIAAHGDAPDRFSAQP